MIHIPFNNIRQEIVCLPCVKPYIHLLESLDNITLRIEIQIIKLHGWVDTLDVVFKEEKDPISKHVLLRPNLHEDGLLPDILQPRHSLVIYELIQIISSLADAACAFIVDPLTILDVSCIIETESIFLDWEKVPLSQLEHDRHPYC